MNVGITYLECFTGERPCKIQLAFHALTPACRGRVLNTGRSEWLVNLFVLFLQCGFLDDSRGGGVVVAECRLAGLGHNLRRHRRGFRVWISRPKGVVVEIQHVGFRFGTQDRSHASIAEWDAFFPARRDSIECEFHGDVPPYIRTAAARLIIGVNLESST